MSATLNTHQVNEIVDVTVQDEIVTTSYARQALAVLRVAFGLTFLWAFVDKLLALGYHTGYDQAGTLDRFGDAAWINGGSPTEGFLTFGVNPDSPFASFFNNLAGYAVVDWMFMLGLLAIGVALTLGVGIRIGAISGFAMYLFMYAAVMVPENNPIIDDHLIGAIAWSSSHSPWPATPGASARPGPGPTWSVGSASSADRIRQHRPTRRRPAPSSRSSPAPPGATVPSGWEGTARTAAGAANLIAGARHRPVHDGTNVRVLELAATGDPVTLALGHGESKTGPGGG